MFYHGFSFPFMLRPFNSSHVLSFLLFVILSSLTFFVFLNVHTVNHRLPCPFIVHVRPRSLFVSAIWSIVSAHILSFCRFIFSRFLSFLGFVLCLQVLFLLSSALFHYSPCSFFQHNCAECSKALLIYLKGLPRTCRCKKGSMILNQFHIKAAATTTATKFNTPKIIDLLSVTVEHHWWQYIPTLFVTFSAERSSKRDRWRPSSRFAITPVSVQKGCLTFKKWTQNLRSIFDTSASLPKRSANLHRTIFLISRNFMEFLHTKTSFPKSFYRLFETMVPRVGLGMQASRNHTTRDSGSWISLNISKHPQTLGHWQRSFHHNRIKLL